MKVIKVNSDQSLSWADEADPVVKNGEVLIEVCAAAVNRADLLQREGKYPPPPGAPEWMGLEVAGTISHIDDNACLSPTGKKWEIGDKVCVLLPGGGYAEKVTTPAELMLPIPDGVSMEEAASIPEVFCTAYLNLFIEAELKSGECILVQAGASGVGIAAIQLAKACGAKVVTTVSGKEKVAAVKKLGADIVVDRTCEDLGAVLETCESDGIPIDVALDCVGGEKLGKYMSMMARGGRWILISTLGGITSEVPLRPVLKKGLKLVGSTLRSRTIQQKTQVVKELYDNLWPKLANGSIKPVIHKTFPITDAVQAHNILLNRQNIGKVVLIVKDCEGGTNGS